MTRPGAYTDVFCEQHGTTHTDGLAAAATGAAAGDLSRATTAAQRVADVGRHLLYTRAPAQQRPQLAVVCTAGLAAEHDMDTEHGIDLEDLDPQHSLTTDPTVTQLRVAAQLLGDGIWIAVKLPGEYEGDDDLDDDTAIRRWTTVALYPDELGWLREALALNADTTQDDDDDGLENRWQCALRPGWIPESSDAAAGSASRIALRLLGPPVVSRPKTTGRPRGFATLSASPAMWVRRKRRSLPFWSYLGRISGSATRGGTRACDEVTGRRVTTGSLTLW